MELQSLFSTPLFYDYLSIENPSLRQFCYDLKNNEKDWKDSLGYQSGNLDLNSRELQPLIQEINKRLLEIKEGYYTLEKKCNIYISNGWANISYPNGRCYGNHVPHLHPMRFLSCVYYIQAEENSGELVLVSPNQISEYSLPDQIRTENHKFNANRWYIDPEEGKLLIFPGWLMHYVENNQSSKDRISLAFNIMIEPLEEYLNKIN